METEKKIHILDSGVFLEGALGMFSDKPCVTAYHVLEEMKSAKALIEMDRFLLSGLQLLDPSEKSIAEVERAKKKTQDKVSRTDISLVALALDFKNKKKDYVLVSDDYGIQNLCKLMKLNVMPLSTRGIKKVIEWNGRCRACGFRTNEKICPNCGSAVKFGARAVGRIIALP